MVMRPTSRLMSSVLIRSCQDLRLPPQKSLLHSVVQWNFNSATAGSSRSIFSTSQLHFAIEVDDKSLKTKAEIDEFLGKLSTEQKALLFSQLSLSILTHKRKHGESGYEIHHYLSKFGRPTTYVDGYDDPVGRTDGLGNSRTEKLESPSASGVEETHLNEKTPASGRDIYAVGLKNALPFVGFGFLDNLIMIIAGDYIDITIGTALGISTMAAAALGNTISDVAGIASAWYVEYFSEKLGIHTPVLTPFQASSWQVRWSINAGRALGVTIGCLLGMIPLLWLPLPLSKEKEDAGDKKK